MTIQVKGAINVVHENYGQASTPAWPTKKLLSVLPSDHGHASIKFEGDAGFDSFSFSSTELKNIRIWVGVTEDPAASGMGVVLPTEWSGKIVQSFAGNSGAVISATAKDERGGQDLIAVIEGKGGTCTTSISFLADLIGDSQQQYDLWVLAGDSPRPPSE